MAQRPRHWPPDSGAGPPQALPLHAPPGTPGPRLGQQLSVLFCSCSSQIWLLAGVTDEPALEPRLRMEVPCHSFCTG